MLSKHKPGRHHFVGMWQYHRNVKVFQFPLYLLCKTIVFKECFNDWVLQMKENITSDFKMNCIREMLQKSNATNEGEYYCLFQNELYS